MTLDERLEEIKKHVLSVTKNEPRERRKFALDFLRHYERYNLLLDQTINRFNKTIELGYGSLNPQVMIVSDISPTAELRTKILPAFSKMGLEEIDLYFHHTKFVKTKRHLSKRQKVTDDLVSILKPKIILSFDEDFSCEDERIIVIDTGLILSDLLNTGDSEVRRSLNSSFKTLNKNLR